MAMLVITRVNPYEISERILSMDLWGFPDMVDIPNRRHLPGFVSYQGHGHPVIHCLDDLEHPP